MSKLSNQTNSQDPQAVNSRIFVGNLNTFQCSKTDVERMFQRYGRLAGKIVHLIKISARSMYFKKIFFDFNWTTFVASSLLQKILSLLHFYHVPLTLLACDKGWSSARAKLNNTKSLGRRHSSFFHVVFFTQIN